MDQHISSHYIKYQRSLRDRISLSHVKHRLHLVFNVIIQDFDYSFTCNNYCRNEVSPISEMLKIDGFLHDDGIENGETNKQIIKQTQI